MQEFVGRLPAKFLVKEGLSKETFNFLIRREWKQVSDDYKTFNAEAFPIFITA